MLGSGGSGISGLYKMRLVCSRAPSFHLPRGRRQQGGARVRLHLRSCPLALANVEGLGFNSTGSGRRSETPRGAPPGRSLPVGRAGRRPAGGGRSTRQGPREPSCAPGAGASEATGLTLGGHFLGRILLKLPPSPTSFTLSDKTEGSSGQELPRESKRTTPAPCHPTSCAQAGRGRGEHPGLLPELSLGDGSGFCEVIGTGCLSDSRGGDPQGGLCGVPCTSEFEHCQGAERNAVSGSTLWGILHQQDGGDQRHPHGDSCLLWQSKRL